MDAWCGEKNVDSVPNYYLVNLDGDREEDRPPRSIVRYIVVRTGVTEVYHGFSLVKNLDLFKSRIKVELVVTN